MTYVISDIHGALDKYLAILDTIGFSDEDDLYVLGDIVDRGPESADILQDMSCRSNVFPILGDHDLLASMMLRRLMDGAPEDSLEAEKWLCEGGEATLTSFRKLPEEEQEWLLDYISEFSLYEVVTVGGQKYILVHGGLGNYAPGKKISEYTLPELLYGPNDPHKTYYQKSVLVTGHVPTYQIDEASRGKVFHGPRQLCIDCGAGDGLGLGCVCLDTGEEYYV